MLGMAARHIRAIPGCSGNSSIPLVWVAGEIWPLAQSSLSLRCTTVHIL